MTWSRSMKLPYCDCIPDSARLLLVVLSGTGREQEIRYLQLLKDELAMISQAMRNEETKQVRADISIEEFNEILKPIIYDPDVISFHRKVQKGDSHPTPALPE